MICYYLIRFVFNSCFSHSVRNVNLHLNNCTQVPGCCMRSLIEDIQTTRSMDFASHATNQRVSVPSVCDMRKIYCPMVQAKRVRKPR